MSSGITIPAMQRNHLENNLSTPHAAESDLLEYSLGIDIHLIISSRDKLLMEDVKMHHKDKECFILTC